ncbi:MAG: hypothetical protein IT395_05790 [Candidatus Omnitrophica bacterium]|nr:hypothetical protein [Candidatus Omnitrophota bacterium]
MPAEYNQNIINMREILRVIFKKKWLIFTVFLLSLIGAFVYINMAVPVYEASTKILISSARKNVAPYNTELDAIRRAQPNVTQGEVIRGSIILDEVVRSLQLDLREDKVEFYPRLKKIVQPAIDATIKTLKGIYTSIKMAILGTQSKPVEIAKFDEAVDQLRSNIEVDQVEDSDVFFLTVTDYNPQYASRIANQIAKEYIIFNLQEQILNLQTRYGMLHPKILQLQEATLNLKSMGVDAPIQGFNALGLATVKVVESAKLPYQPKTPKQKLIYILTAIAGLLGGLSLSFVSIAIDNTLKNPWELEEVAKLPVIGSIPRRGSSGQRLDNLTDKITQKGLYQSSYMRIADHLYMAVKDKKLTGLLFADIDDPVNSSMNAFNLAYLFANSYNLKTVLLDANFRNPVLANALSVAKPENLTKTLAGEISLKELQFAKYQKLDVLAAGPSDGNPLLYLTGIEFSNLMSKLKQEYQLVVINGPSYTQCQDPFIVGRQTDGIVISLREDKVKREVAQSIFKLLSDEERNVLGAIFNDRSHPIPGPIYRNV